MTERDALSSMATYGKRMSAGDECCRNMGTAAIAKAEKNEACCKGKLFNKESMSCSPRGVLSEITPDYMLQWDYEGPNIGTLIKYGQVKLDMGQLTKNNDE